jgi:hypothetical protein
MSGIVGNGFGRGRAAPLGAPIRTAHLVHADEQRKGGKGQGRDNPEHRVSIAAVSFCTANEQLAWPLRLAKDAVNPEPSVASTMGQQ